MKTTITLLLVFLLAIGLHAQAPQAFDFQGVARNATGEVISNTKISLRLTIRSVTALGPIHYRETHEPITSSSGIFTVACGSGAVSDGVFKDMEWKADLKYFLQVEVDVTGGSNYTNLGATQILSVPYALHAAEASEAYHAKEANRWINYDPIVQTGVLGGGDFLDPLVDHVAMIWYPRKAAFRAGSISNDQWDDHNIGRSSIAMGEDTRAYGETSIALGSSSSATGDRAVSIGTTNSASGASSTALGYVNYSVGAHSFVLGSGNWVYAYESMAMGSYNDIADKPDPKSPASADRLFQIGNGSSNDNRSNAVTILRNGNFGIGSIVLEPKYILDIGGRPRIRYNPNSANGTSAGIFLDNSKGLPETFIGMKADNEIGFFNKDKWLFWVDDNGNATISGSNYNTSDLRLKRNFASLSNSLAKLTDLNGYHYFWKDSTLDQTLQTGLIAQEVETHFPELVKTDDKGFKSVNYTGLIPHLIESVKELKASVEYLKNLNTSMKAQNEALKAQAGEIEGIRKELNTLLNAAKLSADTAPLNVRADTNSSKANSTEK
ncbi:tail fiber domain-containing protein [Dyadobacter sp. CY323]|uniref:tail fiber domain-containing protein n=1 Tax=Dyadobacter sp. CY323 TaxID=2907302 RepID=UPI001F1C3781|nr:tail fiber domain-containing protein [Dyadobacter sp. CY323]MCE6987768.1 tail fiber domain-containing protein [Dyadobacter sp. CY323]